MATPSPEEIAFINSFSRFTLTTPGQEQLSSSLPEPHPPFHKEFHLFPDLLPEIRDKIWELTLPHDPRVLHVHPVLPLAEPAEYKTSPVSYGGKHPIALSICRDSRAAALRKLTLKFKAYWNLERDYLYVEVKKWRGKEAMEQVSNMRKRGLLDEFKRLALDLRIWDTSVPEHCMTTLRLLHNITHCTLILRSRDWHKDVLDPGVSWSLLAADSPEQTEFKTYDVWSRLVMGYRERMTAYSENDMVANKAEWEARPPGPIVEMGIIEGRKMVTLPFTTSYYEPPGVDFFG